MIYFKCNDFIIVDESGRETIVVVVVVVHDATTRKDEVRVKNKIYW